MDVALGNILMMGNLGKHCVIFRIHWLMPSWAVYLLVVGKESLVITLIPKKNEAIEVKDFCPISFVGGVYKIIAKVLANRLRTIMADIISAS